MRDTKPAKPATPVTQTMSASETRQNFSEVVNRVYRGEERVLIERSGIPVAAVISARDLDRLKSLEERLSEGFRALEQIGEAFKDVSPEEIERETAKALAEVRAEMRAERERAASSASAT